MNLPPLNEKDFDGEKQQTTLVSSPCSHKDVKIISSQEIRCTCGKGWTGFGVAELYNAFKNQP